MNPSYTRRILCTLRILRTLRVLSSSYPLCTLTAPQLRTSASRPLTGGLRAPACPSTQVLKRIGEQWGCHAYMLPTNYRCAPRVLDAARALIEGSLLRAQNKPPLLAAAAAMGRGGGELRTVAFPDRATELDALGGELQRLQRQQPERLCSVAVLCRLRAQVDEVRASAPRPTAVPAPRTLYLESCASRPAGAQEPPRVRGASHRARSARRGAQAVTS